MSAREVESRPGTERVELATGRLKRIDDRQKRRQEKKENYSPSIGGNGLVGLQLLLDTILMEYGLMSCC